jgi:predicted DNA-binding transcriptional regulator YafY
MKSLITQLETLFTLHRVLNDGEFHTLTELGGKIGMVERHTHRYLNLLKKFYAPIQSIPGQGFRYVLKNKGEYVLEITEGAVRSEIAKIEGRAKGLETRRRNSKSLTKALTINPQSK